jgi:hypothetical protein
MTDNFARASMGNEIGNGKYMAGLTDKTTQKGKK